MTNPKPVFPRKPEPRFTEREKGYLGCFIVLGALAISAACIVTVVWLIVSHL